MESLIPVIDQLQDVCNAVTIPLPIDLPLIVVVGTQSSGKSSVIESIVKREFLPRGSGIVTRRPLVIRLLKITDEDIAKTLDNNNINNHNHLISNNKNKQHNNNHITSNNVDFHDADDTDDSFGDWVKFKHLDKVFTNFDEVREEIEKETDRVCGANKGINAEPITLNVYSKNVVNLTLVDLPGLTKNPVGDQPEDIEIQIRDLITQYIRNPKSIILAVTAAHNDFATSEAIKLAREVDPDGKRTLAVLTKLDIMDPGTDALDVLSGKLINIRLGIIGVVNRTQKDILNKKSIQRAIEDEAKFLHRHYPSIADRNGQPYLSKRLSQLLMRHIRDCLPDLRMRINTLLSQYQAQLYSYGEQVTDKEKTIIDAITRFSVSYCDTIKGGEGQIKTTELCGGARIQYIFHDSFGRALTAIDPLEALDNKAILTAARNVAGVRTAICVPDVFELLVIGQIKRLEEPSLRCVELVHQELNRFVKQCGDQIELIRFPKLRAKIEEILTKLLDDRLPVTREAVENLVRYGSAFIDTEHPRLRESLYYHAETTRTLEDGKTINTLNSGGDEASLRHERELRECDVIARKINAYFNIVREEVKVFVPRAIMHCMVNHVKSNLQSALIKEIYHKELFDMLLSESDDIAKRRKETSDMIAALKRANEILNSIHYQK